MTEYVDIITKNGQLTGKIKPKKEAERDGEWHQANHLWIINSKKELLLQKRAPDKKFYPNTWDISTAGNCSAGETPGETTIREAREELGLKIRKDQLTFLFKSQSPFENLAINYRDNHLNYVFLVEMNLKLSDLKIQKDEISAVKFMSYEELEKLIELKDKNYCPHFEYPKLFAYLHRHFS